MTAEKDMIEMRSLLARMTIEQKLELLVAVNRRAWIQSRREPSLGTAADHPNPSCQ